MRTSRFGMFVALLALTAAPALAHGPGRGGACRADIAALCPDVTPGPRAYRSCLAEACPEVTPGPGAFANCLQSAATSQGYKL